MHKKYPDCIHRLTALVGALIAANCHAFEIEAESADLKVRLDTNFKYSNAWRLDRRAPALTETAESLNQDDGDRNFRRGLISNRVDVLTEFDVTYRGFGTRVSGAGWYDTVYNRSNDNDSPFTANATSVPYNEFTAATRKLHGRKAELLDAFVFGGVDMGESKATFRLGRHTVLWGESLFFGANGIAAGQAPIDVIKAISVPGTQFKELIRPVPQLSGQFQLGPRLSIGAYYQFRWEETRLPGAGSYFSNLDTIGAGSERLIVGPPLVPGGGPMAFMRAPDQRARDSGQGGVQMRLKWNDTDLGLYAIRFHDKTPQLYGTPFAPSAANPFTGQIGTYRWVYPENIRTFGMSFSRSIGDLNLAGEFSVRRNMPLSSDLAIDPTGSGNNSGNPLYAVGNTAHAQVSWLALLGPSFMSLESELLGEVAWNRVTRVTRNSAVLNPNADRDALNVRFSYEPRYRQVVPGLDLGVPFGMGYGIGNSSVVGAFYGNKVGNLSLGLNATYLGVWRLSAAYTHFFGPEGASVDSNQHVSFKQSLKDRDFVALSVQRAF